jgi:adenylosuccinate synthase
VTPIYKEFTGWKSSITGVREYSKLPDMAKVFIEGIHELVNRPITYISVGADREATIKVS